MKVVARRITGRSLAACKWAMCGALLACHGVAGAIALLDAYRAALAHDAAVRASAASLRVAQEKASQAEAQLQPFISLALSRASNDVERINANPAGRDVRASERYSSYNQTLQIRQPLLRRALWLSRDHAASLIDSGEAALRQEQGQAALRVTAAYLDLMLAQDEVALALEERAFLRQGLDAAHKTWVAGSGTRTDVDDVQVRIDLHETHILDAQQRLEQARRALAVQTGLEVGALATWIPGRTPLPVSEAASLDDWLLRAEASSAELQGAKARVEAGRAWVARERAGHEPTLDAFAQVTRSGSETVTTPESRYTSRSVGIQLTVPLYAGGGTQSAVREAAADLDRAEAELDQLRRTLFLRVAQAYHATQYQARKIDALTRAEASALRGLESARRSARAGVRSSLDVIDAERHLQSARRELSAAHYEYLKSRLALRVLAGEDPLPEITRQNELLRAAD